MLENTNVFILSETYLCAFWDFFLFWVLFSFGPLRLMLFVLRAICDTVTCLSVLDIIYKAKFSSDSILGSTPSLPEGENVFLRWT